MDKKNLIYKVLPMALLLLLIVAMGFQTIRTKKQLNDLLAEAEKEKKLYKLSIEAQHDLILGGAEHTGGVCIKKISDIFSDIEKINLSKQSNFDHFDLLVNESHHLVYDCFQSPINATAKRQRDTLLKELGLMERASEEHRRRYQNLAEQLQVRQQSFMTVARWKPQDLPLFKAEHLLNQRNQ